MCDKGFEYKVSGGTLPDAEPYDPDLVAKNIAEAISRSAFGNLESNSEEPQMDYNQTKSSGENIAATRSQVGRVALGVVKSPLSVYNNR